MKLLQTGPSPRGWHRLQLMLECPQKWSYRYNMDLEPAFPAAALTKGSMMHLALAHHYKRMQNKQQGKPENEWLDPVLALHQSCQEEPGNQEFLEMISEVYQQYTSRYRTEDLAWKIVAVEEMAYTTVKDEKTGKEHLLTGRFDLVVEDRQGKIWVVDHKTTSRLSSAHAKFYAVSGQLLGYEYIARQIFGSQLGGIMLNLVQHTGSVKFERLKISPRPFMSSQFSQTVIDAETMIEDLTNSGRDHMKWPKAMNELTCYTRYGACPYIDHCKYGVP